MKSSKIHLGLNCFVILLKIFCFTFTSRTFDQPSATNIGSLGQQQQQQQQHQQSHPPKPSGPFGLDPNVISEIEKDWIRVDQVEHLEAPRVDISLLFEPIKVISTKDGHRYPQDKFDQLLARSRYMQQAATGGLIGNISPYMNPQQQQQQYNTFYQQNLVNQPPK